MKNWIIFKLAFVIAIATTIVAVVLKFQHNADAQKFIIAAIVLSVLFTISALCEIYSTKHMDKFEKTLWTIGFICFNTIAGLLFFLKGKKKF